MIKEDGEEATKKFVKEHYNIPDGINDWKQIDMFAKKEQMRRNEEFKKS